MTAARETMPALSYFLENSTFEMQRDAIRAYAIAYGESCAKEAREDAEGWQQQVSDRIDDALQFAKERDEWKAKALVARAEALTAAAAACDRVASEYRSAYKGRGDTIDRSQLYNPHTDGCSDGAFAAAEAVRALIVKEQGA